MESQVKNKNCSKCNICLPAIVGNFYKDSSKKDGLSPSCADCCRKTKKATYKNITSARLKKERSLIKETPEYLASIAHKKEISKFKSKIRQKKYRDNNKDKIKESAKRYNKKPISKEKRSIYKRKEYNKMKNCPYRKYIHYMRVKVNGIISNKINKVSVSNSILFNKDQFIKHIESLFKDGMSWDNYGRSGWHIDHVRPIASFDKSVNGWEFEAFGLSNLQPLFYYENCSKGSLYNGIRYKEQIINNRSSKK